MSKNVHKSKTADRPQSITKPGWKRRRKYPKGDVADAAAAIGLFQEELGEQRQRERQELVALGALHDQLCRGADLLLHAVVGAAGRPSTLGPPEAPDGVEAAGAPDLPHHEHLAVLVRRLGQGDRAAQEELRGLVGRASAVWGDYVRLAERVEDHLIHCVAGPNLDKANAVRRMLTANLRVEARPSAHPLERLLVARLIYGVAANLYAEGLTSSRAYATNEGQAWLRRYQGAADARVLAAMRALAAFRRDQELQQAARVDAERDLRPPGRDSV